MAITVNGELVYGLERNGVYHKNFTMRLPTLEDIETALEEAGEGACLPRIARHKWGLCVTSLGSIPPEDIDAELLAALPSYDYAKLEEAEDALLKKLASASAETSTPSA